MTGALSLCAVALLGVSCVASAVGSEQSTCVVTLPNGRTPARNAGVNHGNGRLFVGLWEHGRVVVQPSDVSQDGSIDAKFGWWRSAAGRLQITATRIDGPAPAARAHIPSGYGRKGFQSTSISFPTVGCWRVTGTVGRLARLTFITSVEVKS
jgi:hypothetical protein